MELAITRVGETDHPIFTAHLRDITDRKRVEAERTELLAREQRARASAEEANRAKDQFLATISHELRTPLTAILGWTSMLRTRQFEPDRLQQIHESVYRNAEMQAQIVNDLLDVSRIVMGQLRLDLQPVDACEVARLSLETIRPAALAKGVRLESDIPVAECLVSADAARLQQVIWNLLSNAVKFTPKKGRVQVRVERVNSHIEIVVSDTGVGIRPDFLPHVFERFRQADAGPTRQTAGLGLGLSIVRHIIEMHGGSVDVASDGEGKGATFRVRLPVMIVHDAAVREPREHPRTEKQAPLAVLRSLAGIRVLAIDDEEDALGLLRVVLEAAGAEVVTTASAIDALQRVAAIKPDVLVADLGMPQMDGFEFITRIRSSADMAIREIPAAALTAFARSEDRTKALDSGFEMHLAKPVDPAELVSSVATLVRRRPQRR
jgi:signal transduction histidine kinase/CheY-like chemotaxis protein